MLTTAQRIAVTRSNDGIATNATHSRDMDAAAGRMRPQYQSSLTCRLSVKIGQDGLAASCVGFDGVRTRSYTRRVPPLTPRLIVSTAGGIPNTTLAPDL